MTSLDEARAALRERLGIGARYDDPAAPARELSWARRGTAYFARQLNALSDADLDGEAVPEGLTRRHVIAAISYEARALAQMAEWARTGTAQQDADPFAGIEEAVALAVTLPAGALRHLFKHSEVHLNVEWRDLSATAWDVPFTLAGGTQATSRGLVRVRAQSIWLGAVDLDNGGSHRDFPPDLADALLAGRYLKGFEMVKDLDTATGRLFASPAYPAVPVAGETASYPVHRIFCVGRNYAEHAKEMGVEVDREAPFYFLKDAQAIVQSGETVPYPPGTANYHYEMELVIAIGKPVFQASREAAASAIYGYACGLDMTRRDLQLDARAKQRPWDLGKNFEQSAVIAPIVKAEAFGAVGPQRIRLRVGDAVRQDAHLSDLVWSPVELISHLSGYYHLAPGDLIYTGTPAGVGAVMAGDRIRGEIDGLAPVELTIGPAQ